MADPKQRVHLRYTCPRSESLAGLITVHCTQYWCCGRQMRRPSLPCLGKPDAVTLVYVCVCTRTAGSVNVGTATSPFVVGSSDDEPGEVHSSSRARVFAQRREDGEVMVASSDEEGQILVPSSSEEEQGELLSTRIMNPATAKGATAPVTAWAHDAHADADHLDEPSADSAELAELAGAANVANPDSPLSIDEVDMEEAEADPVAAKTPAISPAALSYARVIMQPYKVGRMFDRPKQCCVGCDV